MCSSRSATFLDFPVEESRALEEPASLLGLPLPPSLLPGCAEPPRDMPFHTYGLVPTSPSARDIPTASSVPGGCLFETQPESLCPVKPSRPSEQAGTSLTHPRAVRTQPWLSPFTVRLWDLGGQEFPVCLSVPEPSLAS